MLHHARLLRPLAAPLALAAALTAALLLAGSATLRAESDAPGAATVTAAPGAPRAGSLTILHTNDWHGYALPQTPKRATKSRPKVPAGGLAATARYVEEVKAERGAGSVLFLDAGDCLTGFPAATLSESGVKGATFMRAYGALGLDAWAIGNHDFDAGRGNAAAIVALVPAPCLVANLLRTEDGQAALPRTTPYKIFERGGLRVAVIGFTAPDLARLASAETMSGMRALPLVEAARPLVERLEREADLVVGLTHAGLDQDRALAKAVPGFDVIVGGHSHTRLDRPVIEGATLIVQAGCNGREVGRLDLAVEGGRVISHKGGLHAPLAEGVTPSAAMAEPLGRIQRYTDELEGEVLGETAHALPRGSYHGETPIGSFVADAIRRAARADVGLVNSGGVRADFDKGPVTRAELLKCLPNDDRLATVTATGAQLELTVRHNAWAAATKDHGILQVGGLRYRWRRADRGGKVDVEVLKVWVGGKPLDPERTYVIASTEFTLKEQSEKYLGWRPASVSVLERGTHAALLEAFKEGPIEAPDRFRIFEEREKRPAAPRPEPRPAPRSGPDADETDPEDPTPKEPAPKEPVPAGGGADDGEREGAPARADEDADARRCVHGDEAAGR